jgi:ribonuclease Z
LNIPIRFLQSIKEGMDYTDDKGNIFLNETITYDATASRSYAFVTDTAKNPNIIPIVVGVDLLYHEATFSDEGKKRAKETGHSTARQAAEIAQKAKVKKLVLGHFSNRYKNLESMLIEAKEEYANTHLAFDGAIFNIEEPK